MAPQEPRTTALWDFVGIGASILCMAHCLLLPAVVVAAPFLGLGVLLSDTFHRLLLLLILPAGALGLLPGVARHRHGAVLALGALGIALLVLAGVAGEPVLGEWGEKGMTLLGGAAMLAAHIRNRQLLASPAPDPVPSA
jgi:hypothetical protein